MNTTTHLMTADELLVMPHHESGNDYHYELLRGELKKMAPAGGTHGIICMKLGTALSLFVEANNLGAVFGAETGFIVERDPDTVLGADIAFVSHERLRGVENNGVSALCGVRRLLPAASSVARLA